jgi:protein-S-isoprenylcysteine O-methyltransferase Ste14
VLVTVYLLVAVHTAIYRALMPSKASWQERPRYEASRATRAFRWVLPVIYLIALVDFPLALYVFGVSPPGPARFAAGLAFAAAALALLAWSLRTLGENFSDCHDGRLPATVVTRGPYRLFGHPIYVANVLLLVAFTLLVAHVVVVLVTVVAAIFYGISARDEDRALRALRAAGSRGP